MQSHRAHNGAVVRVNRQRLRLMPSYMRGSDSLFTDGWTLVSMTFEIVRDLKRTPNKFRQLKYFYCICERLIVCLVIINPQLSSSSVAVLCPSLVPRILSTTNTSIATMVNVTCSDDQILTTGQLYAMSACDALGHWTPDVPDCTGLCIQL